MPDWVSDNEGLFWWIAIGSAVMFVGSLLAMPWIVARIPADYFKPKKRQPLGIARQHPALRITLLILRNLLGIVLLLAGIAMLVLPGQGILTMLVGIMLINFPGKYRLERWVIRKPKVFKAINWLRAKANRPPLEMPEESDEGDAAESDAQSDAASKKDEEAGAMQQAKTSSKGSSSDSSTKARSMV